MGQVIPFSKIESYLDDLEKQGAPKGTILDTNILISASYEMRDAHADVVKLWEMLQLKNYQLFATVNTRSEYLEFQRRLILSESLFDATDDFSEYKISSRARAKVQTLKGRNTYRKMGYKINEDERLMGPLASYSRQDR